MMASKRHVFVFQITWMTESRISKLVAVIGSIGSTKAWSGVREATAVGEDGRMVADMANYIFLWISCGGKMSVVYASQGYLYVK